MTTEFINGGTVKVMQRVKTGDYEHKEVSAELTFSTFEDDEEGAGRAKLDTAMDMANDRVRRTLGLGEHAVVPKAGRRTVEAPSNRKEPVVAEAAKAVADPFVPAGSVTATAPASGTGAADPFGVATPATNTVTERSLATAPNVTAGSTQGTQGASEDPFASGASAGQATANTAGAATDEDLFTGTASEITNEQLRERCAAHQAKVKNAVAIRALIGKYVAPPAPVTGIAQEKRAAFLLELEKVGPVA
jgi:hypothetical protein